jgi:hypothetical protein
MTEIVKNELDINEYWNSNNIRLEYIHRKLFKTKNPYQSDLFINGNGDIFRCLDGFNTQNISFRNISVKIPNSENHIVKTSQSVFQQNFQNHEISIKPKPILNFNLIGKKFKNNTNQIKTKLLNDEQLINKLYNGETITIDNHTISNNYVYKWDYCIDDSVIDVLSKNHIGYKIEVFSDFIILIKF